MHKIMFGLLKMSFKYQVFMSSCLNFLLVCEFFVRLFGFGLFTLIAFTLIKKKIFFFVVMVVVFIIWFKLLVRVEILDGH